MCTYLFSVYHQHSVYCYAFFKGYEYFYEQKHLYCVIGKLGYEAKAVITDTNFNLKTMRCC